MREDGKRKRRKRKTKEREGSLGAALLPFPYRLALTVL
jgi:hypothetical protein